MAQLPSVALNVEGLKSNVIELSHVRDAFAEVAATSAPTVRTMPTTKGSKALNLQVNKLAQDLKAALARIKALEEALKAATNASHPLLQGSEAQPVKPNVTAVEPGYEELYEERVQEATEMMGSLLVGADGKARHLGESAHSANLLTLIDTTDNCPGLDPRVTACFGMSSEIIELHNAYPMGIADCAYETDHFTDFLPPRDRALELVDLYYAQFAVLHLPIPRSDLMKTFVDPIYQGNEVGSACAIHPHKLSVMFVVLASGTLCDDPAFASTLAHQYYVLSRASLSLRPITQEANTATVQAVFMHIWFLYATRFDNSSEERWVLSGICIKVAQIIGLQRDGAGWNMDEDEIQRRRILFWEIYVYDSWSGIGMGRPPLINLQYTDCRLPRDHDPALISADKTEVGFHAWKFRFVVSCLTPVLHYFFGRKKTSYAELLALDKKIRQLNPPDHLIPPMNVSQSDWFWSSNPAKAIQQYTVLAVIESNILYIHRNYFAQAIREEPLDPLKHKYGPSVMASYRSAYRMICGMTDLYTLHPEATSKHEFSWASVFSACVVFAALIIESPGSSLACEAFLSYQKMVLFFKMVRSKESSSQSTLIMLQRLLQRSQDAYAAFHFNSPRDGVVPNGLAPELDELAILGGRKSIINLGSAAHAPAVQTAHSSGHDDSFRPSPAFDFNILAGTVAPPPGAVQNGSELGEMSPFFMNHVGHSHQEVPAFNMPTFERELRGHFFDNEPYAETSALDQTFGLPEEGDFTATTIPSQGEDMPWSMLAAQLLP
ncbi:hypothetical protein FIBSPDRAFT_1045841 [Athelia psychrophila]|uniref:Xylanolytic transcriptional activator regulatory domain-containing protein n=1 Tax=Athelia psychrophila TaxID=1759441 RepID=A0A166HIV5_9AGAM|nr:hypothetical protein FIBSPDRAFT_1045841 [Fibularhizoctonia sp. CBS 109695]